MTADFVGTPAYAAPEQAAPRFGPVGTALYSLGRPADALPDLAASVATYPNEATVYYWRGEALRQVGRTEEAIADWKQAARLARPDAAPAILHRIAWRLLAGPLPVRDPKRGLELARFASDRWPWAPEFQNTLGLACYRNGMISEAVSALERSSALDVIGRSKGSNLLARAICQAKLGNLPAARDCLKRAISWVAGRDKLTDDQKEEMQSLRSEAEEAIRAAELVAPAQRQK